MVKSVDLHCSLLFLNITLLNISGISRIAVCQFDDSVHIEYVHSFAQHRCNEESRTTTISEQSRNGATATALNSHKPADDCGPIHAGQYGNAIPTDSTDESNGHAVASYSAISSASIDGPEHDDSTAFATSAATWNSRYTDSVPIGADHSTAAFTDDSTPAATTAIGPDSTSTTSAINDSEPSAATCTTATTTAAAQSRVLL